MPHIADLCAPVAVHIVVARSHDRGQARGRHYDATGWCHLRCERFLRPVAAPRVGSGVADDLPSSLAFSSNSSGVEHGAMTDGCCAAEHAGQVVTVHVAEHTITIDLGGDDARTIRRTTTQAVRSIKAHRPRKARAAPVS